MKYWEENSSTAILKFYGEISYWWNGANDFTNTIDEIEKKYTNLKIRLHCYGGQVFEGSAMFNALRRSKLNIEWIIDGVSASMASIVMLAKGRIKMAENAFVMIHQPSGVTDGNAGHHLSTAKLLKAMEENFSKEYARRTGMSAQDTAKKFFDGTDHWLSSGECLDMKLIDEVVAPVDANAENIVKPDQGTPIQSVFDKYTALGQPKELPTIQNKSMDKLQIIAALALTGVDANSSDSAVIAAAQARHKEMNDELALLRAAMVAASKERVAVLISAREVALGVKFSDEQKKHFVATGEKAGVDVLDTVLNAIQPTSQLRDIVAAEKGTMGGMPDKARDAWTWDDYEKHDAAALETMPDDRRGKLYKQKFGSEPQ